MNSKIPKYFRSLVFLFFVPFFTACSHHISTRDGRSNGGVPFDGRSETGFASWYGDQFNGKKTSSGEIYNMYAMTAAHRYAPFGTNVRVTNLDTGKQTIVTINDRGPFVRGRIIDLSRKASEEIGMMANGTAKVRLDFLDRKPIIAVNTSTGDIYIQTASFESEGNAKDYLETFQHTLPSISARIYNENSFYRIRTGPYSSQDAAEADIVILKKAHFDGFILHTN
jgi:rare lipoprotein A